MIEVEPARVFLTICVAMGVMFAVGMFVGRRIGYAEGLATWRKQYRYMTQRAVAKEAVDEMLPYFRRFANAQTSLEERYIVRQAIRAALSPRDADAVAMGTEK